jgi:uncharacterized membrane protein
MSTLTNNLLRTAAIVFAIASGSAAVAQTTSSATSATSTSATSTSATTSASATKAATSSTAAAQNAVAATAVAASKAQQPTGLTRAQVQAEFLEARKNGTLLQTEADFDVAQTRKHVAN